MDDFEKELKIGFLEEAGQSLSETEQCFLSLESESRDPDVFERIFRLAHNLKGSSKAVGFEEMGAFTHQFESLLLKLKNNQIELQTDIVSLLLRCNDHLIEMIQTLKDNLDANIDSTTLMQEIQMYLDGRYEKKDSSIQQAESATESVSDEIPSPSQEQADANTSLEDEIIADFVINEQTMNTDSFTIEDISLDDLALFENEKSLNVQTEQILPDDPMPEIITSSEAVMAQVVSTSPKANSTSAQTPQKTATSTVSDESIRVSLQRVEKLQNFVGELVILQAVLKEQASDVNSLLLRKTIHQLGKVCKEVQDISMSLRMVPVKPTFQKMQRIVRDTAQALAKEVQLVTFGEETELDKTILEKINDPLVHLIRNAVDHGIEAKDLRLERSKPAKGTVKLSAYNQSGKLVIEINDDGGGLDPEKLKSVAIKKGILKANNTISDKEAYKLIFAAGFSTKEQTTDISGRGVGMDVVRTNIEAISGEIFIDSQITKGTTFKIMLPLTMAIIDGMVVKCGTERYVVPLAHVHESVSPKTEDLKTLTGIGDVLMLRGENIPAVRLAHLLGRKSSAASNEMIAIIVRTGVKPFALMVDDIIGQYQVVTKQLGEEIQYLNGFAGSTILGDGRPALIIEPIDLFSQSSKTSSRQEIRRAS